MSKFCPLRGSFWPFSGSKKSFSGLFESWFGVVQKSIVSDFPLLWGPAVALTREKTGGFWFLRIHRFVNQYISSIVYRRSSSYNILMIPWSILFWTVGGKKSWIRYGFDLFWTHDSIRIGFRFILKSWIGFEFRFGKNESYRDTWNCPLS